MSPPRPSLPPPALVQSLGDDLRLELIGAPPAPVIVVLGGISASSHVAAHQGDARPGWWEDFVGSDRAIDGDRYRVLGLDYCTRKRGVTTVDQACLLARALDLLGIPAVHAIVGASYGGMVALAFAAHFPRRVHRLVIISAAHESHPMATAWRVIQRRVARLGLAAGRAGEGLGLARALAMTTYRTADEFARRFPGEPSAEGAGWRWPVEDYLDHHARRFASSWPVDRFLSLSESLDLHRVDPSLVRVPAVLVAVAQDTLVPLWQMRELAGRMSATSRMVEISSEYGHDAFLKEPALLAPIISSALHDGEFDA